MVFDLMTVDLSCVLVLWNGKQINYHHFMSFNLYYFACFSFIYHCLVYILFYCSIGVNSSRKHGDKLFIYLQLYICNNF